MIDPQKYIVFKRSEFKEILDHSGNSWKLRSFEQIEKEGATVILPEDVFASSALFGYAASIGVALNLLPTNHPDRKHLRELADYFQQQAEEAHDKGYKVPD